MGEASGSGAAAHGVPVVEPVVEPQPVDADAPPAPADADAPQGK